MTSNQNFRTSIPQLISVLRGRPQAYAYIEGDRSIYPNLEGLVRFYQTRSGVIVLAEVSGLPVATNPCNSPIFGFHIHEGGSCSGSVNEPFAGSGMHFNPNNCRHPYHAGDLPPLFGSNGFAVSLFLTDRFNVEEIIGRTVIIHENPDDFTSQPSGNSGNKIACGIINANYRIPRANQR